MKNEDTVLMTGQEWYERYTKEIEIVTKNMPETFAFAKRNNLSKEVIAAVIGHSIDKAARKASGLE